MPINVHYSNFLLRLMTSKNFERHNTGVLCHVFHHLPVEDLQTTVVASIAKQRQGGMEFHRSDGLLMVPKYPIGAHR